MRTLPASCKLLLCVLVLPFAPAMAQANAGTPLMIAEAIHLVIGNAIIGLLEGAILAWLFQRSWWKAIVFLIAANYFSTWLGFHVLKGKVQSDLDWNIENFFGGFTFLVALAYFMTLVLEFPFVYLVMKPGPGRLRNAVKGSLIVQSISYLLLVWIYGMASANSLLGKTSVVPLAEMHPPSSIQIAFLGKGDGTVYAGDLGQKQWTELAEGKTNQLPGRLILIKQAENADLCDLAIRRYESSSATVVQKGFAQTRETTWPDHDQQGNRQAVTEVQNQMTTLWNFGDVLKLGEARESDWSFSTDVWAAYGLRGRNEKSGQSIHFAVETPMVRWTVRNAIHLPGDQVLFQLGDDQICLFDPVKNQIALVARGHGPTAILRKPH